MVSPASPVFDESDKATAGTTATMLIGSASISTEGVDEDVTLIDMVEVSGGAAEPCSVTTYWNDILMRPVPVRVIGNERRGKKALMKPEEGVLLTTGVVVARTPDKETTVTWTASSRLVSLLKNTTDRFVVWP